ncbi:DUF6520 family protein [Flavobacterium johnsoniae]|uniref:DUF6520 family protein n=1 Tax=Flavobacterium johnsoniae TaxID=986 RepID=UPI0025B18149|nr:DUF6520 family protein [Flavobacterium johnsoniae]WJS93379.1 DUF6520 family protein [Flavobacterium johnsoniae]
MKSINLKQAVPVMVFALAIAGAFTTSAMERSSRAAINVDAYKRLNPAGLCDEEKFTCSTNNLNDICRVDYTNPSSQQLWAKNSNGSCAVQVYREE